MELKVTKRSALAPQTRQTLDHAAVAAMDFGICSRRVVGSLWAVNKRIKLSCPGLFDICFHVC